MSNLRLVLLASAIGLVSFTAQGGPLTEARVTKIINKVQVVDPAKGAHPAALHETIRDEIALKTGVKSRSELLFQDNTLTRLGPETSFSFNAGTRDLSLEKGTLLLQVPKGLGGAKIRTAAVTAAITGTTILMEYTPSKHIKVLVLEGSLRLSVNGRFGDSVVLRPGRMVLMRPDAKKIPPPVSVDLKKIMRTSSLVNMSGKNGGSLPSADLIEREIAHQAHEKGRAVLVETDVVIHGSGTTALNSTGNVIDVLTRNEQGRSLAVATTSSGPTGPGSDSSAATPASTPAGSASSPGSNPSPTPAAQANPSPTPTSSGGDDGDDEDKDKDKDKGDHNDDGHADNGKGRGKHEGKTLRVTPPALDRGRVSARESFSPATKLTPMRSARNER